MYIMSLSFTGGSISQAVEINTLKLNVSTLSTGLNTVKTQYVDLSTLINITNSGKLDVNVFDAFSTFQTETVSSIQGQIAEINNGAISESLQTQINTLTGTTINSLLLDPSSDLSQTFSRYLLSSVQNSIDLNQNSTILTKLDTVTFNNYVTTNNTRVDTLSTVVNSISSAINTKYDTALSTNTSRISTLSSFVNTQNAALTTNIQTLSSFVNTQDTGLRNNISTLSSFLNTNVSTLNTAIAARVATTDFNTYRSSISTVTQSLADTDYSWERRFLSVEEYIRAMENTYKIEYTDPATNTLKEYKYTASFQGLNVPPPPFSITGITNGLNVNNTLFANSWGITIVISPYGFSIMNKLTRTNGSDVLKSAFTQSNNYRLTLGISKDLLNPSFSFVDSRNNVIYSIQITQQLIDQFVSPINPNTPQNELDQRIVPNASRLQTVSDGWGLNDANLLNATNLLLVSPPDSGDNDGDQFTQEYIGSVRNSADLSGNAVLLNRIGTGPAGFSSTAQLILAIQQAGARMVIIYRNQDESAVSFAPSTFGNQVTIPVITISESVGIKLYSRLRRTVLFNSVLTNSPATTFASLLVKKNAQDQYVYDEHMLVFQDRRGNLPQIISFTNLLPEVSPSGQALVNETRLHKWQFTPTSSTVKAFLKIADQSTGYGVRIESLKQADSSQNLINTNVTLINTQRFSIIDGNIISSLDGWATYTNYSSTEDLTFNNLTPGEQYILEVTTDINELIKIDMGIILIDNGYPLSITYVSSELYSLPIEFDENGLSIIDTFNTDPYYITGNPQAGIPPYPNEINPLIYTTLPIANNIGQPGRYIDGANQYIIAERYTGVTSYNTNITTPAIFLKASSFTKSNLPFTFNDILSRVYISTKEQLINGLGLSQYTNNYLAGSLLQYDPLSYIDVSCNFSFRWKTGNVIQPAGSNDLVLVIVHKFNSNALTSDVLSTVYKLDYNRNVISNTGIFNVDLEPGYYKFSIVTLKDNDDLNILNNYLYNNISVVLDDFVLFRYDSELKLNNPALFNNLNVSTNRVFNNGQFIINANSSFRLDNTQIVEAGYVYSTSPNVDINSPYKKIVYDLTTPIDPSNNYSLNTSLTTGLVENTLYYIKGYVKTASKTVDDNIGLDEIIYTNEVQEYTLSRPLTTLLNVGQVTSNSIKVNYSIDNYGRFDNAFDSDPVVQFPLFRVQYKLASENDSAYQVYDPYRFTTNQNVKTSAIIAGLLPGTEYDIRIASFNPITGITPYLTESLRVSTVEGAPVVTFDSDAVDSNNDGRANITINQVNNNVTITNVILLSTGGSNRIMTKVGLLYTDNPSIASSDINIANANVQKIEVTSNMVDNNNYTFALTGLNNNKSYRFRAFAINNSLTNDLEKIGYTKIDVFNTVIINPVVQSQIVDMTLIQSNNVTLQGTLVSDGGDNIVSIGFELSPGGQALTDINKTILTIPGAFNTQSGQYNFSILYSTLTGLQLLSNTTYQFRAWAKNSKNIFIYGSTISFTTAISTPTVSTSTVVNITNNSVSAGGTLVSTGGDTIIRRGIVYSTINENDGPEVGNVNSIFVTAPTNTVGSYVLVINGLSASTTYYVRAFAENSLGISYGLLTSFTTQNSSYVPPPLFTGTNALMNAANTNFGYQIGGVNFINGCPTSDPEVFATNSTIVGLVSSNTGIVSSGSGALRAYRFVFVPTTTTTKIYINNPSGFTNEEGILSIHKEGTSVNLVAANILTQVGGGSLDYIASTILSGLTVTNIFRSARTTGQSTANMSVLTLNNLVVGTRYVITTFTTFNDGQRDISFAVLDSSDINLPVYFSNFRAYSALPLDLVASNDVGPRGGSIGSGLNEVPSQGASSLLPAVYTSNITNIARLGATVGANVTSVGSDSDPSTVTCGIIYSSINANLTKNNPNSTTVSIGTGLGAKTFNLTGLIANTVYYVRAWVTSGFGTAYGAIVPFTTLMPYQIQTVRARNIESSQLDFVINRVSLDGQLGYLYSTTEQNPVVTSLNSTKVDISGAVVSGINTITIDNLLADTEYYIRPFIAASSVEIFDVGYGVPIKVRTRIGNTTNIAPDVDLSGNDLPLETYNEIYYKYSFTTGVSDTGISMQLNLRKIKPTTDNFIMHIVDGSGVSIMTPLNTTVTGNIGKSEINSGNNVLLSSYNAADGIITITGLESNTTYFIVTKVIDPTIGGEIQVNIVGNNTPGVYIPLTYVAVSQVLSDVYTQLPYAITYGLLDGLQVSADKVTTSSINVDGTVKVFRTSAQQIFNPSPEFTVISDSTISQITTRQYSYVYLTSTTPVYVTYDGVEYDISGTAYGLGVFVPQNDTYIYKLEARDSVVDPSGRLVHITQQTSEHMGDGMYLVTLGVLPNSDKVVSFTKISAFRLIGQAFGAEYNGWNTDQFTLVQDNANKYVFKLNNVPFNQGEFKIRTDSQWPQGNSGIFGALDLELDTSGGITGMQDPNIQGYVDNMVFNGINALYNVTLNMEDVQRIKLYLVPSSGVVATRFIETSATINNTTLVTHNKIGLNITYTGNYSTSGIVYNTTSNVQLGGSSINIPIGAQFDVNNYNYLIQGLLPQTTYYIRYYVKDVYNSIVYSNEVSVTTLATPLFTFLSAVNNGSNSTVITYNYVGATSGQYRLTSNPTNSGWTTNPGTSGSPLITIQQGNNLTLTANNVYEEGAYLRVVDVANFEYVSQPYQIPSLYNTTVNITEVTASGNNITVKYNVNNAFTGYNNGLTDPAMWLDFKIGASWLAYTQIGGKLTVDSSNNTVIGYTSALSGGQIIEFRFRSVIGDYILSNVGSYTAPSNTKTILEIADHTQVTQNIYINSSTYILELFSSGVREVKVPYKNLATNTYHFTPVYGAALPITYSDITPSLYYLVAGNFPFANSQIYYDEQRGAFKDSSNVVYGQLPLSLPLDFQVVSATINNPTLTITYNATKVLALDVQRIRNGWIWDSLGNLNTVIGNNNTIQITVDSSRFTDNIEVLGFRLTDGSLTLKTTYRIPQPFIIPQISALTYNYGSILFNNVSYNSSGSVYLNDIYAGWFSTSTVPIGQTVLWVYSVNPSNIGKTAVIKQNDTTSVSLPITLVQNSPNTINFIPLEILSITKNSNNISVTFNSRITGQANNVYYITILVSDNETTGYTVLKQGAFANESLHYGTNRTSTITLNTSELSSLTNGKYIRFAAPEWSDFVLSNTYQLTV